MAAKKSTKKSTKKVRSIFAPGTKVKYTGGRNSDLKGKTLEVIGPRDAKGVWVKTANGKRRSAMASRLVKAA